MIFVLDTVRYHITEKDSLGDIFDDADEVGKHEEIYYKAEDNFYYTWLTFALGIDPTEKGSKTCEENVTAYSHELNK